MVADCKGNPCHNWDINKDSGTFSLTNCPQPSQKTAWLNKLKRKWSSMRQSEIAWLKSKYSHRFLGVVVNLVLCYIVCRECQTQLCFDNWSDRKKSSNLNRFTWDKDSQSNRIHCSLGNVFFQGLIFLAPFLLDDSNIYYHQKLPIKVNVSQWWWSVLYPASFGFRCWNATEKFPSFEANLYHNTVLEVFKCKLGEHHAAYIFVKTGTFHQSFLIELLPLPSGGGYVLPYSGGSDRGGKKNT